MNGIDILWALLTLLSVILFISGDWLAQRKIRLLNYVLLVTGVIYLAEVFQTLQNLGKMGYLFRMLTGPSGHRSSPSASTASGPVRGLPAVDAASGR